MKKITLLISLITALILMLGITAPVSASTEKILVYTGDNAWNNGYSKFGMAADRDVDTSSVLPGDLSSYCCIILPANRSEFSSETIIALVSFVQNGGKILAQADQGSPGSSFLGAITNMNNLASALGSSLSLKAADIDMGLHTTTNIDPSPFTNGVASIMYLWTSEVSVGPHAYSLIRSQGGLTDRTTIIGAEKIGKGWLILCGDINIFSDYPGTGYTLHDNGMLARNICEYNDIEVNIDIKPGSEKNTVNLRSKGVLPVAIINSDDFDIIEVVPETVMFAGASPARWTMEDVDDDGDMDILFHFRTQDLCIPRDMNEISSSGETQTGTLSGETQTGEAFSANGSINIVPKK